MIFHIKTYFKMKPKRKCNHIFEKNAMVSQKLILFFTWNSLLSIRLGSKSEKRCCAIYCLAPAWLSKGKRYAVGMVIGDEQPVIELRPDDTDEAGDVQRVTECVGEWKLGGVKELWTQVWPHLLHVLQVPADWGDIKLRIIAWPKQTLLKLTRDQVCLYDDHKKIVALYE